MAIAYADRSGVITIEAGRGNAPDGVLVFARGPFPRVNSAVAACARHAYDGETLLVPGIPEAETDDAALDALIAFRTMVARRLSSARSAA